MERITENPRPSLTLFELNSLVKEALNAVLPGEYWVEAEVSELRERSGNCYMEIVQKDPSSNVTVARSQAKCWRGTWQLVRNSFERTAGQVLRPGLKVRLRVYAQFHENYGFSWIVTDIDPDFTLGDMARKRQLIIRKLKEEGVFDLNKELEIPMFAQRIAVISSSSAAGYGDFCNQLEANAYGFDFHTELFGAIMQGENTERSIIEALDRINGRAGEFDCVAIIRGGGATSDMSAFDSFELAENVANFPLPVITGIGHERDESVVDMVANTRTKTPTAVAAFLIDNLKRVLDRIEDAQGRLVNAVMARMKYENMRIDRLSERIPMLFSILKTRCSATVENLNMRLKNAVKDRLHSSSERIKDLSLSIDTLVERRITAEKHRMEMLSQRISALDPDLILRRGYSITLHDGRAVHAADELSPGDTVETRFHKGTAVLTVDDTTKKE